MKTSFLLLSLLLILGVLASCSRVGENTNVATAPTAQLPPAQAPVPTTTATPSPFPNLQAELLDKRNRSTASPLGKFDFRNYTYPLPHGWQNPDGSSDIKLVNGKVTPNAGKVSEDMSDEEKAAIKSQRRIGMSFVTVKY